MEDTFDRRRLWMEDNHWCKTTFNGRLPLIKGLFDFDLFDNIVNLFIEEEVFEVDELQVTKN